MTGPRFRLYRVKVSTECPFVSFTPVLADRDPWSLYRRKDHAKQPRLRQHAIRHTQHIRDAVSAVEKAKHAATP